MDLKELIYVEKILTDEQCDQLVAEREARDSESSREQSANALTGEIISSTFEQVELIPHTNNFDVVHNASEQIIKNWLRYIEGFQRFNVFALRNSARYSHKYRLLRYKEGQWIHPHIDWWDFCVGSLTIALNDESEYTGGDFSFFNGEHKIRLKKGEAMVFPANPFYVHEVTPIETGTRYSLNSFLESVPNDIGRSIELELERMQSHFVNNPTPYYYNLD